jgi:hypothetical protein
VTINVVGCTPTTTIVEKRVPVAVQLNRPERPSFPKIMNDEVGCLSNSTQKQLLARDHAMKAYMYELEDIIDATHSSK